MDWFAFIGALFVLFPISFLYSSWGKGNAPIVKLLLTSFFVIVFALFMSLPGFSFNLLGRIFVAMFTMQYDLVFPPEVIK